MNWRKRLNRYRALKRANTLLPMPATAAELEAIEHYIEALEPIEKTIFTQHYINGKSWVYIACCMGYTERTLHYIAAKVFNEKGKIENEKIEN